MEIVAYSTLRFLPCALPGHRARASASIDRRPSLRICREIGSSDQFFDPLPGKSVSTPECNSRNRCCRLIASASSGKNGNKSSSSKEVGKWKDDQRRKEESKKKDNVWSSGFGIDKGNKPAPEKKQEKKYKSNVRNRDLASSKSSSQQQLQSSSKTNRGSGDRGRINVLEEQTKVEEIDAFVHPRVESSNSEKTNVPSEDEQLDDGEDVAHLRFLSPALPIEEETLLQPEESIPDPVWTTFCSSTSGVWRGVGATFSPITGEFEPICLDENKQFLYDARVLSSVETNRTSEDGKVLPPTEQSLHRQVQWSLENTSLDYRESTLMVQDNKGRDDLRDASYFSQGVVYDEEVESGYWEDDEDEDNEDDSKWEYILADPEEVDERWENGDAEGFEVMEEMEDNSGFIREDGTEWRSMWDRREVLNGDWEAEGLPSGESESILIAEETTSIAEPPTSSNSVEPAYFTPGTMWTDVMEEDQMVWEPGLVFFEDGAYSRGPVELLTDTSSSGHEDFNSYTSKVEQCLVAGGHKRLRIVHTVSVDEEEKIEVLRVAAYEEEWMGPCNMKSISDVGGHQLKLFSERDRHSPEDIVGTWKVFEVQGVAIDLDKPSVNEKGSFVFSCKETSIKRGFPVMPKLVSYEDDSIDVSDFSITWLTGNISTYVSQGDSGTLTFGVGWVCENGTRLVMERVYGADGRLVHVKSKSEIRIGGARQ